MSNEGDEVMVIQEPASPQEITFTINPIGPSIIERLKRNCDQAKIQEQGMSAASIIAMTTPPYYPLDSPIRKTAAQDLRDLLEKSGRMEALTAEWVTIPYTGNVGMTERLVDPDRP